jgi:hypothetical protein
MYIHEKCYRNLLNPTNNIDLYPNIRMNKLLPLTIKKEENIIKKLVWQLMGVQRRKEQGIVIATITVQVAKEKGAKIKGLESNNSGTRGCKFTK